MNNYLDTLTGTLPDLSQANKTLISFKKEILTAKIQNKNNP